MNEKMAIWNAVAKVPATALKTIQAGRLKGKSDINPQARYQLMTEQFGPCGVGWKFAIEKLWTEPGDGGEIFAFSEVSLYFRHGESWSEPIPGIGGHKLVASETKALHNNDEAFKMATTDALGTAMKMIGVAAEVYLGNFDGSKYRGQHTPPDSGAQPTHRPAGPVRHPTENQLKRLHAIAKSHGWDETAIHAYTLKEWGVAHTKALSIDQYNLLCGDAEKGITGILESPPPDQPDDQQRYDAKAKLIIDAATDWVTFKAAVTKIAHGYVSGGMDFKATGSAASEKMMFLVGEAAENGDDPDSLRTHVDSWAHFSAEQRAQLRTTLDAIAHARGDRQPGDEFQGGLPPLDEPGPH